ncbi:polyprenyl synthetase family protein [Collinsella phocaeensis]|uniref:polyprenyl synthetase family protein n=1 Tax=Collinsella phocaeensis TaxID=1871016 RepID=UPI000931B6EA|nr:polyprenyl synthetase family protein [Collinsella phocaeensis]
MDGLFATFLREHAGDLDAYLGSFFCDQTDNADVETYLYAPLKRYSDNAGKRHRPLICMLACRAVGGSMEHARSAAAAIEHFQSAALIHDDIADNGQLRRGKPCLHITEGEGLAINCGDLDLTLVFSSVLRDPALDDAVKLRVLGELSDMTVRTIEGQALDLGWVRDGRFDIGVADYLAMASRKTAYYSGAIPLACGAIIGGGDETQIEGLRAFGMDTGLAFQIQDDLLNLLGDPTEKDFRTDITEGKRTLIAVHALETAAEAQRAELLKILTSGSSEREDLDRAVAIFEATGSLDFARTYAHDLTERAKAGLASLDLEAEAKELFSSMADFFVDRLK